MPRCLRPARVGGGIHATDVGALGLQGSGGFREDWNASHVLGRALWHALALTDASPCAPQLCSTSREDKRTGFTVPPQTTRDLLGHPRERETGRGNIKHKGRGRGGVEEQEERCIQSQRAGLPQVMMMMISIVLFQKQTELGSIYLEEGTDLGDTRQETQHEDIYTVLKRPFFCLALPFPILPCAPHLLPLFCQSWSLALSLLSAIARAPLS